MTDFIIKSTVAMGVLLAFYYLLFEREKMHRFNRFYLLGTLVFSLVLPLISFTFESDLLPSSKEIEITTVSETVMAPTVTYSAAPETVYKPETNYIPYIIWSIYSIVTLILSIRFIKSLLSFRRKVITNPSIRNGNIKLVLLKEKTLPHTFLNYVFINREEYEMNLIEKELFTHEFTHVNQKHTLDILFIEVLKTLFWFNPLLYIYKKAIQLNHEFLADEKVIDSTANTVYYQNLLLEKVSVGAAFSLASNLNFSLTKKRFIMMTKKSENRTIILKKLLVLPTTLILFTIFCIDVVARPTIAKQLVKTSEKDSLSEKDKRRDVYYAGVTVNIQDKIRNVTINKPYEELTLEEKRQYMFIVPEPKVKKVPSVQEFEDYKNKSKYAIWLNDKNIDNKELNKYKNTDIAHITGSSVFKNARTKQHPQPYQFQLYTNDYFDAHLKNDYLKYPDNTYSVTIMQDKKTPGKKEKITSYAVDYSATEPDVFAGFDEGFKNFPKFVENNFKNPYSKGTTLLRFKYIFDIEKDGSITNIKIERITENPENVNRAEAEILEQELKRVIKLSEPKWFPAKKSNKPISTTIAMHFVFDTMM